jgi:hypothetical protein
MLLFLLDEILFVPAILVTAALLAVAFFWRRTGESYRYFWWTVVVACFVVTLCYTLYSLAMPLYSQQDHRPDNPGGPGKWSSPPAMFTILFLITFVIIPSFPVLFGLALLPPRNLKSSWRIALTVFISLYVVLALALIYSKHVRYMADYRQERAKPRQSRFERFEHLRQAPAPQRRRRSQQDQQQDQKQPQPQPLA